MSDAGAASDSSASTENATTTRQKTLPTRAKAAGGKANIGFTFVDQSEDLRSLADKRIVSSSQRHAIRSHVMKSVRHSENLIGKKRPTGRESTRKSTSKALKTALPLIEAQLLSTPSLTDGESSPSVSSEVSERQLSRIPADPSTRMDPFYTLPGNDGPSYALIESLVQYCFWTFLPMTFPVEREAEHVVMSRRGIILKSKISNPGSFFGMMAIVAAHRAITSKRHHDLRPSNFDHGLLLFDDEYAIMKDYAIRATRTKTMETATVDDDSMEATFSLIGAATIIGNFQEARIYLEGIRQNLNGSRTLQGATSAVAFIPMSDVKAAVGMLSRPMFTYPWASEEETETLLASSTPAPGSRMEAVGTAFYEMNRSAGLDWDLNKLLLDVMRVSIGICWFGQAVADHPRQLKVSDHEIFRRKTIEMEHRILDYVYEDDDVQTLYVHPVEQLIRLTILSMASSFLSQALPSAGLGRALSHHHVNAYQVYQQSLAFSNPSTLLERRCILWCLFQYVHSASGQPEESYFLGILGDVVTDLGITTWEEAEDILYTFLYVPALQEKLWYKIWNNMKDLLHRRYSINNWADISLR